MTPEQAAGHAALDEWARRWAEHHGTGETHAAAIRAWATPTRPERPALPLSADITPRQELAWAWQDRVTEAMGRVKERRGMSLYERLPGDSGAWNARHCGRDGCECTHGRYRNQGRGDPGDWCDRGFVGAPDDPDGIRQVVRCPTCRQHAEATKAATT